jgi:hypothetical protein
MIKKLKIKAIFTLFMFHNLIHCCKIKCFSRVFHHLHIAPKCGAFHFTFQKNRNGGIFTKCTGFMQIDCVISSHATIFLSNLTHQEPMELR